MKKLYEKNELTFAIVWIVIYCVFAVPGESAERNNRNRILRKRSFLHIADDRSSRLYTKERFAASCACSALDFWRK